MAAVPAFGQSDTSSLAGTVRDPDGGVIPGAVVDLRSRATNAQRETVTDERGHYVFALLAPGGYELTVQIAGFKRFRDSDVLVQVAQSAVLDARLAIGEVAESVQVKGTATLLDVTSSGTNQWHAAGYLPHAAHSSDNAGFVRVEKRFSEGLSILSSYTFGKALTNAPQFRNAGGVNGSENSPPQDSFNLEAENALAYYDVRHRIYTMQSGFPFTINVQSDTAGVGAGTGGIFVRPNRVPGVDQVAASIVNGQYLNTTAFSIPPAFTFGNLGRNSVVGPGYVDLDAVLAKSIKLARRSTMQLRAEAFNLLSRRNYNLVGRIINDPSTFGKVLSQFDPRQLQLAIKWTF